MTTLFDTNPTSAARISPCGRYRYSLGRRWGYGDRFITWIMLNPSTADAATDDPTIRRCIAFSLAWGFDGLTVLNLFPLRATDPKAMLRAVDPIGPEPDDVVFASIQPGTTVVAAWGKHGSHRERDKRVEALIAAKGVTLLCLGMNENGSPKHPLYLPAATELVSWGVEVRP